MVAVLAALAGCGGSSTRTRASRCNDVPRVLRTSLERSLKSPRKLTSPAAVRSRDSFRAGLRDLSSGLYFVSADVRPDPGLTTWAVAVPAFPTGRGLIFGIGPAARAVSVYGAGLNTRALGGTEHSDGYSASRACATRLTRGRG